MVKIAFVIVDEVKAVEACLVRETEPVLANEACLDVEAEPVAMEACLDTEAKSVAARSDVIIVVLDA